MEEFLYAKYSCLSIFILKPRLQEQIHISQRSHLKDNEKILLLRS